MLIDHPWGGGILMTLLSVKVMLLRVANRPEFFGTVPNSATVSLEPQAVAVSPYGWLMTYYGWLAGLSRLAVVSTVAA